MENDEIPEEEQGNVDRAKPLEIALRKFCDENKVDCVCFFHHEGFVWGHTMARSDDPPVRFGMAHAILKDGEENFVSTIIRDFDKFRRRQANTAGIN